MFDTYEVCEHCRGSSVYTSELSHTNHMLHQILKNQEKMMAQIDDLNAVLATIQTELADVATQAATIETDLVNAQNNTGVDLSGPIATANDIATRLAAVDASLTAAVAPPATGPGSVPPSSTPPATS